MCSSHDAGSDLRGQGGKGSPAGRLGDSIEPKLNRRNDGPLRGGIFKSYWKRLSVDK